MATETPRIGKLPSFAENSFALFVALRYVSVGRRSQLVSFMSMLSISGLALGISILITVLSVMNGFDREVRENILGILPHGTVKALDRVSLEQWAAVQEVLDENPTVLATAPLIEETGVLAVPGYAKGVIVNGVDPAMEAQISIIDRFMISGGLAGLSEGRFRILLGATLAENLGVGLGDKVGLYSLNVSVNPLVALPTQRQFTVAGIYRVGTLELDSAMAMITLQDAQALYRYRDTYTGIRFKVEDLLAIRGEAQLLSTTLPQGFEVETWTRLFGNIYENIQFSRSIVGFLLWLLVGVAAFNLVVSHFAHHRREPQDDRPHLHDPGLHRGTNRHRHRGKPRRDLLTHRRRLRGAGGANLRYSAAQRRGLSGGFPALADSHRRHSGCEHWGLPA